MPTSFDKTSARLRAALRRVVKSTAVLDQIIAEGLKLDPWSIKAGTLNGRIDRVIKAAKATRRTRALSDAIWKWIDKMPLSLITGSPITRFPLLTLTDGEIALFLRSALPEEEWMAKRARIARQVCRIERKDPTGSGAWGTGCLVAPSIVMTNCHVVDQNLRDAINDDPARIIFRFDYAAPGATGRVSELSQDWDLASDPALGLDYALLRLADAPGDDQISDGKTRGSMAIPRAAPLTVGDPLCIVQYPDGQPLSIAVGIPGVKKLEGKTRVTYGVSTRERSSGSPCFDKDWRFVALHHAGSYEPNANEGVPIDAIRDDLPTSLRSELTFVP